MVPSRYREACGFEGLMEQDFGLLLPYGRGPGRSCVEPRQLGSPGIFDLTFCFVLVEEL